MFDATTAKAPARTEPWACVVCKAPITEERRFVYCGQACQDEDLALAAAHGLDPRVPL